MYPAIALTSGDTNGIGLEVTLKTLHTCDSYPFTPVLICPPDLVAAHMELLDFELDYQPIESIEQIRQPGQLYLLSSSELFTEEDVAFTPGRISREAGRLAMESVEAAINLCMEGKTEAMVTAPISKEAIKLAGYDFPGHTEYLVQKTGASAYSMMLVNEKLRVVPGTIHIPIREVSGAISQTTILRQLEVINLSLKVDFKIRDPHIAVLGLNPHAGDGGVIGDEEQKIIEPAIRQALNLNLNVHGPFPADGFFGSHAYKEYDAVFSMYHDQGLVPFKALTFNKGMNFTAGLPIVRTSPDHGTAFGIAGQNKASAGSYKEAVQLATTLAQKRHSNQVNSRSNSNDYEQ